MSVQNPKRRRPYQRPQLPDVRPDGYPDMATLRARARQVDYQPNTQEDFETEDFDTELDTSNPPVSRRRFHFPKDRRVLAVLTGMLLLIGGVLFWQQAVIPTWNNLQDQWNYGSAHITQMDADVGHGGVSHFLAEYYKGNIIVIEISLSNPNNAHIYTLSGMEDGTNTPVILLSLEDMHHDGKPDLLIQVEGTGLATVLYNTGTAFQRSEG